MAENEQVKLDDYITSEDIEDVYIELVGDYKKLSKQFTTLKNEHASCPYASCPSIYENILRDKNELFVKIVKLQTENDDLKICLKRYTDAASTSSAAHVQNQTGRTGSGPDRICHASLPKISENGDATRAGDVYTRGKYLTYTR